MEVRLIMFKNDGQRRDFPVTGRITSVGRGEDCGLRVPLLSVSRRHCELSLTGEEMKVRDLGSSNGTYLNNNRINEEEVLKAGDRLAVGPVVFTVQIDGQPEEIQPVKAEDQKADDEDKQVEEGAATPDVDVAATVSTDRAEAPTVSADRAEDVEPEPEPEPETVQVPEPPEEELEAEIEEELEEEIEEQSTLDTIVDSGDEEIDPISALEALADKRGKGKRPKPSSE